ncbi:UPF0158 family protein [Micrococcaceae bacterium Sec5.7]
MNQTFYDDARQEYDSLRGNASWRRFGQKTGVIRAKVTGWSAFHYTAGGPIRLSLDAIDLESLGVALEYRTDGDTFWWLDPQTGEIGFWVSGTADESDESDEDLEERGAIRVEPVSSHESYSDMEDFIAGVDDAQARDLLSRAIERQRPFRHFKDTLLEFPELREGWFAFHDRTMRRRAIEWLVDVGVVDGNEAEKALEQ